MTTATRTRRKKTTIKTRKSLEELVNAFLEKYGTFVTPYKGTSLNEPPVGIIFGKTGHGKSTELASSFSHYEWFLTTRTVNSRAEHLHELEPDKMPAPPAIRSLCNDRYDPYITDFNKQKVPTGGWGMWLHDLHVNMERRAKTAKAKGLPAPSYVLDDAGVLWEWIWRDICDRIPLQGKGMYRRIEVCKQLLAFCIRTARNGPFGMVWSCHEAPVKYFEEEGGANEGEIQWPLGPKFPIGSMIDIAVRDMDFCGQIYMTDEEHEDGEGQWLSFIPQENERRKMRRQLEDMVPIQLTTDNMLKDVLSSMMFDIGAIDVDK